MPETKTSVPLAHSLTPAGPVANPAAAERLHETLAEASAADGWTATLEAAWPALAPVAGASPYLAGLMRRRPAHLRRLLEMDPAEGLARILRDTDALAFAQIVPKPLGPGNLGLKPYRFSYTGNGSGDIKLRIGPKNANQGRFQGSIDDLSISADVPLDRTMPEHFETYCLDCHDSETEKGKVNLETLSFNLDTIPRAELWHKVLGAMNAGEMPPEDKKQLTASEKTACLDDLAHELVDARAILSDSGGLITMRRLNRGEYENTVRTLLGVDVEARHVEAGLGQLEGQRQPHVAQADHPDTGLSGIDPPA